ncbi:UPF0481 protein At3g47200-like [Carya illinoinensis]|uniref:UPF0481 protein At3g47200-like n=1 Tax=Carya illinoinensis TaxID=32201 RepID=UPI001C71F3A4|nr:UPF0481 protein At3g47200-like [Carya illinoinensis]
MAESKPVVSKVEMPSKVVRIEDGETSCQGRDQLVISFEGGTDAERFKQRAKVQKVIFLLRDDKRFVKYYEPRVVSLGPIHHGKEKYRLAETFKHKLAKVFVERSQKTIKEICEVIDGKIKELRECFEEEVTKKYNDIDLTWILVVDGCAILQYIDLAINGTFKDHGIKNDSVAFCQRDLFLLENQVPYLLLKLLMSLSNVEDELMNSVKEFIKINHQMVLRDESSDPKSGKQPENPTHLLDLPRSSLLGPENKSHEAVASNGGKKYRNKSSDWQSNGNVPELKAAGIHVKPSRDNSLRGIYFDICLHLFPGRLWLPPLIVDDSTGPKLLNLIAYDMCLDFDNDFGITYDIRIFPRFNHR